MLKNLTLISFHFLSGFIFGYSMVQDEKSVLKISPMLGQYLKEKKMNVQTQIEESDKVLLVDIY